MLLAVDTATRVMSIALHDGQTLLSEQSWHTGQQHTTELAPAIRNMMDACEIPMSALDAVAVSIGPGSYSGVRIGVAFAKGIAAMRALPLVGITTLDILAAGQPFHQNGSGLITVVEAGRGRIIVKAYRRHHGTWQSRTEPRLITWEGLLNILDGPAHITGEINQTGLDTIKQAQEDDVPLTLAPPANRLRRAGFLAEAALEQLEMASDDPSAFAPTKLVPVYIKSEE